MNTGPSRRTTLWLAARGGSADRLRILLTVLATAMATFILLALCVALSIPSDDDRVHSYRVAVFNDRGLLPGVIATALLLCVPVVLFAGHCARIGGPERDQRLAAIRLVGATPREVQRIVLAETGLAATLGTALGLLVGVVAKALLSHGDQGQLAVPADIDPAPWLVALVVVAVPIASVGAALLALRRVAVGPLGVVRRQRSRPPAVFPAVLFVVGTVGLAGWMSAIRHFAVQEIGPWLLVGFLLFLATVLGLTLGAASLSHEIGRRLAPRAARPALLIAARRLDASPFTASRATSAVLLAVLLGAGVLGTRSNFLLQQADSVDPFYKNTFDLLNVVLAVGVVLGALGLLVVTAEAVVTRRRTLAALVASGTPRRTLAASVLMETLIPLVPMALAAAATGLLVVRQMFGTSVEVYGGDGPTNPVVAVPVPWAGLSILVGGTLVVVLLTTALAQAFLRRSTDVSELRTS